MILIAFLFIAYLKDEPAEEKVNSESSLVGTEERENIKQFWSHYRKATALRIDGKWSAAIEEYENALAFNGRHEDALYYLGNMYWEVRKYNRAGETWIKLKDVNPNSARVHFQLGNLYLNTQLPELFNIQKAESEFLRTLEINKEETGPLLALGQISLIKGDHDAAREYFSDVIGSNFKSVEAHFLKGYVAWKRGDRKDALNLFTESVALSAPKKDETEVIGEGDTKSGKSFERKNDQDLFYAHILELADIKNKDLGNEMDNKYQKVDEFLATLN